MQNTRNEIGYSERMTVSSHRALLDRVVRSAALAKSERLTTFLKYVCEQTLSGHADEINEQNIGSAVFGRPTDYDSSIDGIVRTQASRLRQRLDLYFQQEGASEPVLIEMPRGGYVPTFRPRPEAVEPTGPSAAVNAPANLNLHTNQDRASSHDLLTRKLWQPVSLAWIVAAVLAVTLAVVLILERRDAAPKNGKAASSNPLWSYLFHDQQRTTAITGDSGLVMWEGITGRNVTLAQYVSGAYRSREEAANISTVIDPINLAGRRYTSVVDLELVAGIAQLAESVGGTLTVRYARDTRPNDFKNGNAILIGAPEANPWVELFEPSLNFVLRNDLSKKNFSILNRHPTGSEPAQWDSEYNNAQPQTQVYAVLAYVSNLSGTGNVLILEGTSMAGTEAAWDFVSDTSELLPFINRIKRSDGAIPHFEVVIGSRNISGSAGKSSILAARVHP